MHAECWYAGVCGWDWRAVGHANFMTPLLILPRFRITKLRSVLAFGPELITRFDDGTVLVLMLLDRDALHTILALLPLFVLDLLKGALRTAKCEFSLMGNTGPSGM